MNKGERAMIKGSCHCGSVHFELDGQVIRFAHCHCDDCRKIHGTTCSSNLVVPAPTFRIAHGQDSLKAYESSPGKQRWFCSKCGAHTHATMNYKPEIVIVRAGLIDGDPGIRPQFHIWVKAKAPWYEIHDDLPQYQEGAPAK